MSKMVGGSLWWLVEGAPIDRDNIRNVNEIFSQKILGYELVRAGN